MSDIGKRNVAKHTSNGTSEANGGGETVPAPTHVNGKSSTTEETAVPSKSSSSSSNNDFKMGFKEAIFVVGALVSVLAAIHWGWSLFEIIDERQRRRPDYEYPKFEDFTLTLQAVAVLCVLRIVLTQTLFHQLGNLVIDKRFQGVEREERVSRFGVVFFKFIVFVVYTTAGAYLLIGQEWTMPAMGGNGNIVAAFVGYPFQTQMPWIKEYYLINMAYHTHSLLFHLTSKRRNDFMEMLLHHIVAIILISFSYLLNFVRGGALVMFLHDFADIPAYLVKSSVDSSYKYFTLTVYLSLLAMWGYARLYVLPFEIIIPVLSGHPAIVEALSRDGNFLPFFIFMLLVLQVMHILWYGLFIQMGLNFLKSGKTEDIQQRITNARNRKKNE